MFASAAPRGEPRKSRRSGEERAPRGGRLAAAPGHEAPEGEAVGDRGALRREIPRRVDEVREGEVQDDALHRGPGHGLDLCFSYLHVSPMFL